MNGALQQRLCRWAGAVVLAGAGRAAATGFGDAAEPPTATDSARVEWHGQFRVRGDALGNLDLDRGVLPDGQPIFAVPAADVSGQWLRQADARLRADVSVIGPRAGWTIRSRWDFLDGVSMGGDAVGLPAASTRVQSQVPVRLKRIYAEALTPVGVLTAGRMGHTWGMGMLANGGDCLDCDSGDAADRVALVSPLAGHLWAAAYDLSASGPSTRRIDTIRALDLDPADDVHTWTGAVMRWNSDAERERRRRAGVSTVNYGMLVSHRTQTLDSPSGYLSSANSTASVAPAWTTRQARAWAVDGWLRWDAPRFRVEAEGAWLDGRIEQASLLPNVQLRAPVTSRAWGAALQSEAWTVDRAWGFGVDAGVASGDPAPGFAAFPQVTDVAAPAGSLRGAQIRLPSDTQATDFRFHSDFRIDRVLFREILGTVTDAIYLRPHVRWTAWDLGTSRFIVQMAGIASAAMEAASTPGGQTPLGLEVDPTLAYTHDDGFSAALDAGFLLPLAGLDDPTGRLPARSAQVWRARLGFVF